MSVAITFSAHVYAETQVIDAGALQQQIQKDAPNLFMAPLPEVGVPKSEQIEGEAAVQILIKGVRLQGVHLVMSRRFWMLWRLA